MTIHGYIRKAYEMSTTGFNNGKIQPPFLKKKQVGGNYLTNYRVVFFCIFRAA
jgi:hypothetical protein